MQVGSCLIVEDHPHARDWLVKAATAAFPGATLIEALTIKEAREKIAIEVPEVAMIDLGLPDGNGQTLIHELDVLREKRQLELKIIVSTVMNDDASIFSAIRSGADGYILKEEELSSLTEMLKGIQRGKPPLSPEIATRLLQQFKVNKEYKDPLAPREREILQVLAKGYTVAKAAEMLGITYNTTSSYVRDIYRKLNISSRAEATMEASKRGLV